MPASERSSPLVGLFFYLMDRAMTRQQLPNRRQRVAWVRDKCRVLNGIPSIANAFFIPSTLSMCFLASSCTALSLARRFPL